jgi:DNA ligase-associated metallophosphoesterase
VYWPAQQALLCADMHIGKSAHFRAHGIAIPHMANKNNFWNLSKVFDTFKPNKLIVLGDMVHSTENGEWSDFTDFLDNYPTVKRILVRGNHELYLNEVYTKMGFEVHDVLQIESFILTHEPLTEIPDGLYNLCGHIHPAVRLTGAGKQSLRAACFWMGARQGVLPACGEFTGTYSVSPKVGDQLFVIAGNTVIEKKI